MRPSFIGLKHMASAGFDGRSSNDGMNAMKKRTSARQSRRPKNKLVVCIRNDGYEGSLDIGKVYAVMPDAQATKFGRIRVVDNEEEDYLYPTEFFIPVELSRPVKKSLSTPRKVTLAHAAS
jgi:hypothetical protein